MNARFIITDTPRRINTSNATQKLRRIQSELSLLQQQISDALARIDAEDKSQ